MHFYLEESNGNPIMKNQQRPYIHFQWLLSQIITNLVT